MTERWYTAAEIAALRLTGLPGTKRGIAKLALREPWPSRPRVQRGGTMQEYPLTALPQAAQTEYATRQSNEAAKAGRLAARTMTLQEDLKRAEDNVERGRYTMAQGWQGRLIDARLAIIHAFEVFCAALAGQTRLTLAVLFCKAYVEEQIEVAGAVREIYPSIGQQRLLTWERELKAKGLAGIAAKYGNRRGTGIIESNPSLYDYTVALLTDKPETHAANLLRSITARFGAGVVHQRTLLRFMNGWKAKNKSLYQSVTNPDGWRNTHMVAFGSRSEGIERPNQRWEMDSTPADIMLADGRYNVLGVIDVATRRARLLVSKTSKAVAVAALLRRALTDWGVPEQVKTDNGSDYVSMHVVRVVKDLDIEHQLCTPFSPDQKPHIERFLQTFLHGPLEMLDGFIGHNVAERKAIEERKPFAKRMFKEQQDGPCYALSAEDFQRFCDQWITNIYEREPHSGLNGKTPAEAYADAAGFAPRMIADERSLDVLLAEHAGGGAGGGTVQKKGLRHDNAWFISAELALHIGERVHVRLDPTDLGRLYVFDHDGQFLTIAENPARTGMNRQEVAAHAKEKQKAELKAARAAIRSIAKRVDTDDLVNEILATKAIDAGKLSYLPKPTESHDTPALAASREAVVDMDAGGPSLARWLRLRTRKQEGQRLSAEEGQWFRQFKLGLRGLEVNVAAPVIEIDSAERRFARWQQIGQRIKDGGPLDAKDAQFHIEYEGTAECKSRQMAAKFFGETGQAASGAA